MLRLEVYLFLLNLDLALNTGPKLNEYIDKRIEKHKSKFSSSAVKSGLEEFADPIKKDVLEVLNKDAIEAYEQVLPSETIDEVAALVDTRVTLAAGKVGLDGVDVGIAAGVGSAEAKAQKTFDQMKKEAIEQAKVQFDNCKASKNHSNYQCRQINVINKRFIKSKFNSGILRGNKFSQCLEEKDTKYKGKIGSEHKLEINECLLIEMEEGQKAGIISGAVVTTTIVAGAIAFKVNQKAVQDLSKRVINDNLEAFVSSQGYEFEDGESFEAKDIDAYAMGIGEQKAIDFVNKQFKAIEQELIKSQSTRSLFELGAIPEECIRKKQISHQRLHQVVLYVKINLI